MNKKLYVLSVGINEFLGRGISDLNGCENDAKGIFNFLKRTSKHSDFEMDGILLLSKEATKANIVKHFQEHLGQAKKDDVAVFYFSGHGAEEDSDDVFSKFTGEDKITTLVCHDSRKDGVSDLADKELRYLIHQVTGNEAEAPHFVLITDSCHSGSVTRDGEFFPKLSEVSSERDWSQYIFSDQLTKEQFQNATELKDVLPQGQHIHLAACRDTQMAYEVKAKGVFTSSLLEVLRRSEGKISYDDLFNRTWDLLKVSKFHERQTPTIHVTRGNEHEADLYFLGGAVKNKSVEAELHFNSLKRKWQLDLGAIHGIDTKSFDKIDIEVFSFDNKILTTGKISKVLADKSYVRIEDEDQLREGTYYKVDLEGMYRHPISFYLSYEEHPKKMDRLRDMFNEMTEEEWIRDKNLALVDSFAVADYMVSIQNDHFIISKTSDKQHRPVVEQQSVNDDNAYEEVPEMMKDIANFHFIEKIANPKTRLHGKTTGSPAAIIEIYRVVDEHNRDRDELLPVEKGNTVYLKPKEQISIRTVNNSRRKNLYFTLLYLNSLYGIQTDWLGETAQEVPVRGDKWLWEKEVIEFGHDDHVIPFEFPETRLTLKLIASEEPFKAHRLKQDALAIPKKELTEPQPPFRKLKRRNPPEGADWMTYDINIVIKNENVTKN